MPAQKAELPRRQVATQFIRVPRTDWAAICAGTKTELRQWGRHAIVHTRLDPPQPIVGYSFQLHRSDADARLLVCDGAWSEPLGAISAESLRAEGYETVREFRRYWIERHGRKRPEGGGWRPLSRVQVLQLRPFTDEDRDTFAEMLLERIYGRWL